MPAEPGTGRGGRRAAQLDHRVFAGRPLARVNAPTGATAEVERGRVRLTSCASARAGGAAVIFDVGQGVLEQIAGKKAVFDIVARAEEGKETQISVNCDFGELGDCGRKRYEVGYEQRRISVRRSSCRQSGRAPAGSIAINSDFSNEGKAVDIYEIRVSVVE